MQCTFRSQKCRLREKMHNVRAVSSVLFGAKLYLGKQPSRRKGIPLKCFRGTDLSNHRELRLMQGNLQNIHCYLGYRISFQAPVFPVCHGRKCWGLRRSWPYRASPRTKVRAAVYLTTSGLRTCHQPQWLWGRGTSHWVKPSFEGQA